LEKVYLNGLLEFFMEIWGILHMYDHLVHFLLICIHLVHFLFIWYIFPVLVSCTKKNLATLVHDHGPMKKFVRQQNSFGRLGETKQFKSVSRLCCRVKSLCIFSHWGDLLPLDIFFLCDLDTSTKIWTVFRIKVML
jgi:hypothetical protein